MKRVFNYLLLAGVIAVVLGAGIFTVQAQVNNRDGYPSFIQKIADKFDLDINEVKAVFDEDRTVRQEQAKADTESRKEEMLNRLIEEEKITAEQKTLILAKQAEIIQKQETFRDLSQEERQEAMKNLREELKVWAEENGIEGNLMFFGRGMRGPGGHFGPNPDGFGPKPDSETQQ